VSIKSSVVGRVCNFPRDEVVTFPKLGYWLSAIPILPALGFVLEKLCCFVLPELYAELKQSQRMSQKLRAGRQKRSDFVRAAPPGPPPPRPPGGERGSGEAAASFDRQWVTFDFDDAWEQIDGRILLAERHVWNWFRHQFAKLVAPDPSTSPYDYRESRLALGYSKLLNQPLANARALLDGVDAVVAQQRPYVDALERNVLSDLVDAPLHFEQGHRVDLYQAGGGVAFVALEDEDDDEGGGEEPDDGKEKDAQASRPAPELKRLRSELEKTKKHYERELRQRDRELTALKDGLAALQEQFAALESKSGATRPRSARPRKEG
jgi:hypothetical protein